MAEYSLIIRGVLTNVNQAWNNVYFIQSTGVVAGYTPLQIITAIGKGFWEKLRLSAGVQAFQHATCRTTEVITTEISGGSNTGLQGSYAVPTGNQAGLVSSTDAMPSSVAYGVRFQRPSNQFRHGYKRLAGVHEGASVGGLIDNTTLGQLNTYALAASEDFSPMDDSGTSLTTVTCWQVVRSMRIGGVSHAPTYARPVSWLVSPYLTTQNTRKVGRGS